MAAAIPHTCGAAATIHVYTVLCRTASLGRVTVRSDISQPEYSSDFKSIDKEPHRDRVSVVEQVDRNIDKRDSVSSLGSDQ